MVSEEYKIHWEQQMHLLKQMTGVSVAYLAKSEGDVMSVLASTQSEKPVRNGASFKISESCIKELIRIDEPKKYLAINGLRNVDFEKQNGFDSFLGFPIGLNAKSAWGVIVLLHDQRIDFSTHTIQAMVTFQKIINDQLELIKKENEDSYSNHSEDQALNFLLDTMNGVPWRMEFRTDKFIFIGKQAEKILGYSHADWPNLKAWSKAVHPDDMEKVIKQSDKNSKQGKDHIIEYRLVRKDGSIIWVKNMMSVILDEHQNPVELRGFVHDITDLKEQQNHLLQMNERVEQEKSLFQTFIDSIQSFIFLKDLEGNLLIANKYYNDFFGKPDLSFTNKKLEDYLSGEASDELRKSELLAIKNKTIKHCEFTARNSKGEQKWFYTSHFPILDVNGEVYALGGTSFDISERVNYENEIQNLNKQLEFILQSTKTELTIVDGVGNILYNSGSGNRTIDRKCYEHFRDRKEKCEECPRHHRRLEKNIFYYEIDGPDKKTIQTTAIPFDPGNGDVHMAEVRVDISPRVAIEKEVAELKNKMEFAMNAGQIAYVEVDLVNGKMKTGSFAKQLTGYDFSEIPIDVDWIVSRVHQDDLKRIKSQLELVSKKELSFEFRFLIVSQDYIWMQFVGEVTKYNEHQKPIEISGVFYDISKQKMLMDELTTEKNLSSQANQAKTSFLANMSHEIRTPMNAIIGFSELISKHVKDPAHKGYLNSIKSSGKMLLTLVNDLLDVSKIEAGKMSLKTESVDVKGLMKDIEQTFILMAQEKNIELKVEEPAYFPNFVTLDAVRTRQILLNLVSNALKFTEKGKVTIKYQFKEGSEKKNCGDVLISVSDTGIGISKDKQKAIFEPFVQADRDGQKKHQGTGLGLSIINKIVNLMGGKILLHSQIKKGSTFTIWLSNVDFSDSSVKKLKQKEAIRLAGNDETSNVSDLIENTSGSLRKLSDEHRVLLTQEFRLNILPIWEELKIIQASDKLTLFSEAIEAISKKYKWIELKNFQKQFELAIRTFDYESIQNCIVEFEQYVRSVEKIAA